MMRCCSIVRILRPAHTRWLIGQTSRGGSAYKEHLNGCCSAGSASYSISQLTRGSRLTRQAVTKHLRVLESVGIVHSVRAGRESLFEFDPEPIAELKEYLDLVSEQWDQALTRLKLFVED